jgi:hypothetical protein
MPTIPTRAAGGPDGALSRREPFRTHGSLTAGVGELGSTGRLPPDEAARYRADSQNPGVVYTVLSYATPIAWVRTDGTVVIPAAHYSVTTSRHQGMCRAWLT